MTGALVILRFLREVEAFMGSDGNTYPLGRPGYAPGDEDRIPRLNAEALIDRGAVEEVRTPPPAEPAPEFVKASEIRSIADRAPAELDRVKTPWERLEAGRLKRIEGKVEAEGSGARLGVEDVTDEPVDLVDQANRSFLAQTEALEQELAAPAPTHAAGSESERPWSLIPGEQIDAMNHDLVLRNIADLLREYCLPQPGREEIDAMGDEELREYLRRICRSDGVRRIHDERERINDIRMAARAFLSYNEIKDRWNIDYPAFTRYLSKRFHVAGFNNESWIYDGGVYKRDRGELKSAIIEIFRVMNMKAMEQEKTRELIFQVTYSNYFPDYPFDLRTDRIPVENGVIRIDYETGARELLPHSPDFRFSYKLPAYYDEQQDPARLTEIFEEWTSEEVAPLLWQLPAQALLQAHGMVFKKSYLIIGVKDTGKTCYAVDLLTPFFGESVISRVALQALMEDRFRVADLEGKILNVRDDLSALTIKEAGKFKELTGSHHHDIYRKGKQGYSGRIFAVHLYTANLIPELRDTVHNDDAFFERWEIIKFLIPHEKDEEFRMRLRSRETISAFLNGVLDTMVRIRRDNIVRLSTSDEIRDLWLVSSDPFKLQEFIERNFDKDTRDLSEQEQLDKDEITTAYQNYCRNDTSHKLKPLAKDRLCQKLENRGFFSRQARVGDKRKHVLTGFRWKAAAPDRPPRKPEQQPISVE